MRYFPDDHGSIEGIHLDPLDRARLSLDFEAMNATAPSVKQVLYKAQTMGPLAPVANGPQMNWPATALAVIALAMLLPWMPIDSSMTVMQVGFEQKIPRFEANELASHLLRNQPENVLVGTQFTRDDHRDGLNVDGQLRVALTAFNVGERELEDTYREQIRSYKGRGFDPMFRVEHQASSRSYRSPAQVLAKVFSPREKPELDVPGHGEIQRLITGSGQLMAQALAPQIEAVEPRVTVRDLSFAPGRGQYDLTVPAWPRPMRLRIENYGSLTAGEQESIRQTVQSFVADAGLTPPETHPVLADGLPLQAQVFDVDGRPNAYLTGRVQAWLAQPDAGALALPTFAPTKMVDEAMEKALPGVPYEARYDDRVESGRRRITAGIYLQPNSAGRDKRDADASRVEDAAVAGDEHIINW